MRASYADSFTMAGQETQYYHYSSTSVYLNGICIPEWYILGYFESLSFEKQAIEINVDGVSIPPVAQNVFSVSVSQSNDESHHGHDGGRASVIGPRAIPLTGLGKGAWEMTVEDRRRESFTQFVKGAFPILAGNGDKWRNR